MSDNTELLFFFIFISYAQLRVTFNIDFLAAAYEHVLTHILYHWTVRL